MEISATVAECAFKPVLIEGALEHYLLSPLVQSERFITSDLKNTLNAANTPCYTAALSCEYFEALCMEAKDIQRDVDFSIQFHRINQRTQSFTVGPVIIESR